MRRFRGAELRGKQSLTPWLEVRRATERGGVKRRALLGCTFLLVAPGAVAAELGLVAHWRFDSGAGETVRDLAGNHTAQIVGAQWAEAEGRKALRFDGQSVVEAPDAPDLRLRGALTVEAWIRPTDLSRWHMIVRKENEYQLRISPPQEANTTAFFVYLGGRWEPRVNGFVPIPGQWLHLAAVWTGDRLQMYHDAQLLEIHRLGAPKGTDSPVRIGHGFVGEIAEVRIYQRALAWDEVLGHAAIRTQLTMGEPVPARFDFSRGLQGWVGLRGLEQPAARDKALSARTLSGTPLIVSPPLDVDAESTPFLTARMAVDAGNRGAVLFAGERGSGEMRFDLCADGRPHTYVVDMAASSSWAARIRRLALAPTDTADAAFQLLSLTAETEPSGAPEIVARPFSLREAIARARSPATLRARLWNVGGAAEGLRARLELPVAARLLKGSADQSLPPMRYEDTTALEWTLRAEGPVEGTAHLAIARGGQTLATFATNLSFSASPGVAQSDYVPQPHPVRGPLELGVKYFPGWESPSRWAPIHDFPERTPVLGSYREGDPEIADWHIKWAVEHGITFFFYDWYWVQGARSLTHALHEGLLKSRYRDLMKFAIFWANHNPPNTSSERDLLNVTEYWIERYFRLPNYLKLNGKPVVGIFAPERFTEDMGEEAVARAFAKMRDRCKAAGLPGLYLIARSVGVREQAELLKREGYDAIWSSPDLREGTEPGATVAPITQLYAAHRNRWGQIAKEAILPCVPMVWSGWDSRPWHGTSAWVLTGHGPKVLKEQLTAAREFIERQSEPRLALVWAWNEWGEGSYIEPHRAFGFGMLDALRSVFTQAPGQHTDLIPADVGRQPPELLEGKFRTAWEFDTAEDLADWQASMHLQDVRLAEGALQAVSSGDDPAFFGPPIWARAKEYPTVVVRVRTDRNDVAQLFWTTRAVPESEATSYHFPVTGDGQWHEYRLPLGTVRTWRGVITRLRLDPANQPQVAVRVDYIRLAKE